MTSMKLGRSFNFKKIALLSLVVFFVAISWIGNIDQWAEKYVDKAIIQATVAYGGARALNAAVSVAQSAQVGFSVGGEASFHPLEILDPVNDMVEDYATAMKYSISSLIIQKLLVEILANNLFKWLMLTGGATLCIGLLFLNGAWATIFLKSFAFIASIRFLFVATILIVSVIDGSFLDGRSNVHIDTVKKVTEFIRPNNVNKTLSSQEEMTINQQVSEKETQKKEVRETISDLDEKIRRAKDDVRAHESNFNIVKKDATFSEKWIPFIDNDRVTAARKELEESEENYDKINSARETKIEEFKKLQDDQSELQKKLQEEEGFISRIKRFVSSKRSPIEIENIKQRLDTSIKAMLNLIALFLLKTLLLPIAFLFLVLRSFKLIWKIDLLPIGVQQRKTKTSP